VDYIIIILKGLSIARPDSIIGLDDRWSFPDGSTVAADGDQMYCTCAHFVNWKCCEHTVAIACISSEDTRIRCDTLVSAYVELQRHAKILIGAIATGTDGAQAIKSQRGERWQA
jgi:hypothetical protein